MNKIAIVEDDVYDLISKYTDLYDNPQLKITRVLVPWQGVLEPDFEPLANIKGVESSETYKPDGPQDFTNFLTGLEADLYLMDGLAKSVGLFSDDIRNIVQLIIQSDYLKQNSVVVSRDPRIIAKAENHGLPVANKGHGLYQEIQKYLS